MPLTEKPTKLSLDVLSKAVGHYQLTVVPSLCVYGKPVNCPLASNINVIDHSTHPSAGLLTCFIGGHQTR